jgi:hypothetical protein
VPKELLSKMINRSLGLNDVRSELERYVRVEYLRALVNTQQVVINRAYLYNNPAVFQDYLQPGESRDAFKELLSFGVIVPFFFNEQTPVDEPTPAEFQVYTKDPRGFPAWQQLCQEVRTRCVRLSWDDEDNREFIRGQLARRFHDFAQNAVSGDVKEYIRDLGMPEGAEKPLRNHLGEMARTCLNFAVQDQLVTRDDLYQKFVTADGTKTAEGKYDKNKLFASEIKRLLDLRYNVNLPDALGGYALTPIDSLPRTALQEWQQLHDPKEINAELLVNLLRQTAFAVVQGGLYLESLGSLSLQDVQEVRRTVEWSNYIQRLQSLLIDPLQFPNPDTGAPAVYQSYVELAGVMTRLAAARRMGQRTARWTPVIELIVDIAGAVLSVVWSSQGMTYKVAGEVSTRIAPRGAPVVVRLIIRGLTELGAQADLKNSIDFMHGRIVDAQNQWEELLGQVSQLKGFTEDKKTAIKQDQHAVINYPEESNE